MKITDLEHSWKYEKQSLDYLTCYKHVIMPRKSQDNSECEFSPQMEKTKNQTMLGLTVKNKSYCGIADFSGCQHPSVAIAIIMCVILPFSFTD